MYTSLDLTALESLFIVCGENVTDEKGNNSEEYQNLAKEIASNRIWSLGCRITVPDLKGDVVKQTLHVSGYFSRRPLGWLPRIKHLRCDCSLQFSISDLQKPEKATRMR